MAKQKTKLKKLDMSSVDFVRRGANQKADIKLYKSAEEDIPQGLMKSIQDTVRAWWNGNQDRMNEFNIQKSAFMDAIDFSLDSIVSDDTMDDVAKAEMAEESLMQFVEAMRAEVMKAIGAYKAPEAALSDEKGREEQTLDGVDKSAGEDNPEGQDLTENYEEGETKMKIDKSRFTPEELTTYQALIAKGLVEEDDPEMEMDPEEEMDEEEEMDKACVPKKMDKGCKTKKSADLHPEVKKALEELETMKKSMEMKELHDVAKKYSVLGKKEDELAETLYSMKKSSPEAYDSYVALLDEQVDMVEKSGLFTEIGKSSRGTGASGSDAVSKINACATEIQKADPTLNRYEAIAKAWDNHPELLAEYEEEYAK